MIAATFHTAKTILLLSCGIMVFCSAPLLFSLSVLRTHAPSNGSYRNPADSLAVDSLLKQAQRYPQARRDSALVIAKIAVQKIRESIVGDSHRDLAFALREVGRLGLNQGKVEEAEQALRQSLAMTVALYPPGDTAVADVTDYLARAVRLQGRLNEAESLYRKALLLKRGIYTADDPELAGGMNNFALLLKAMGRYREADTLYREALAMKWRMYKGDHEDLATGLLNIGSLQLEQGNFQSASNYLDSAVAMLNRLGVERPLLAATVAMRGMAWERGGCTNRAFPLAQEALRIRRKLFPATHPATAASLMQLASIHIAEGDLAMAQRLADTALAMRRTLYAAEHDHPEIAGGLVLSAKIARQQNRFADADTLITPAVAMLRRLYPEGSFTTVGALDELGRLRTAQQRYDEAEKVLGEALAFARTLGDPDNPAVALLLVHFAELYQATSRPTLAADHLQRAIALYQQIGAERFSDAIGAHQMLAAALRSAGQQSEADSAETEFQKFQQQRQLRCQ
ncbi:MAG: tetratricopeptide repeat protein [Armatimonadetes bacterium]|nr:tetratricopeptide repeat protein [Armatimonadota bacterium]